MLPPPKEDTRIPDLQRRVDNLETALRAAFTTISGGRGITITDGGALRLSAANGTSIAYIGGLLPAMPDGTYQPGLVFSREDGTIALALYDAFPAPDGTLNQALTWFDRSGNVVLADDTNSGQGIARPHLSGGLARYRFADMTVAAASTTFETLWIQRVVKQQPQLEVWYRGSMDTAGTTGEVRVLVNGVPWEAVQAHTFAVDTVRIGAAPVAGDHMSTLVVEIQARRTSATGALRVEAMTWFGRQS